MTEIDLCNRALIEIGSSATITAFGTATPAQKALQIVYEPARDELLEMAPWGFATKRRVLAESDEEVSDWTYVYSYPDDCLAAWNVQPYVDTSNSESELIYEPNEIVDTGARNQFEIVIAQDLVHRLIATDIQDAELIYTAKVTNPTMYSKVFCAALVYLIAMRIAPMLASSETTIERVARAYTVTVQAALRKDAREGTNAPTQPNAYVTARE